MDMQLVLVIACVVATIVFVTLYVKEKNISDRVERDRMHGEISKFKSEIVAELEYLKQTDKYEGRHYEEDYEHPKTTR